MQHSAQSNLVRELQNENAKVQHLRGVVKEQESVVVHLEELVTRAVQVDAARFASSSMRMCRSARRKSSGRNYRPNSTILLYIFALVS
jgi:hypothetical protein